MAADVLHGGSYSKKENAYLSDIYETLLSDIHKATFSVPLTLSSSLINLQINNRVANMTYPDAPLIPYGRTV